MIRELLEKNGLLCKDKLDIIYYGSDNEFEVFAIIDRTKKELPSYLGIKTERITDNQAIEQACRQYIKENGFKLEWFRWNYEYHYDDKLEMYELIFDDEDLFVYVKDNKIQTIKKDDYFRSGFVLDKLIAWLFANDIKIKEDNNGM